LQVKQQIGLATYRFGTKKLEERSDPDLVSPSASTEASCISTKKTERKHQMNRKIKALGLALVASLAMSAMVASAAQAEFHSSVHHTIGKGNQIGNHVFTAGEGFGNITCTTAEFHSTQTGTTASSLTIHPTYTGCKDSLAGRTVHVSPGTYTFTTAKSPTGEAEVHVISPFTLHVTSGGGLGTCHVEIPVQTVGGITYHNLGGTNGVTITTNSTGVDSVTSGGFFNCGTANGAHANGTYTGHTTQRGFTTEGAAVEVSVTP
jgi:hypothetical protein